MIFKLGKNISVKSPLERYDDMSIIRDRPRFFDQVRLQTTNASIGNKHFFTE